MKYNLIKNIRGIVVIAFVFMNVSNTTAQNNRLLIRDSLDFLNQKLTINTDANEFSPNIYKGGLLYISNRPLFGSNKQYNRVYWTQDPKFKLIEDEKNLDSSSVRKLKYIYYGNNDDYTAPTSNDNDILVNYRRLKSKFNRVEKEFLLFSTDQAFSYDDSTSLLVWAKKKKNLINGIQHWELWRAYVINGKLRQKRRIIFNDKNADYLYPYIDQQNDKLYFASNKGGGKGGYDIYYVNKEGEEYGNTPIPVNEVNSPQNDISPFMDKDSLFFSSDKEGGLGGFDVYYHLRNGNKEIQNIGYPVNTNNDEVSLKKSGKSYFLTSNRNGHYDVFGIDYAPITYPIRSVLKFKQDGSLVPNHGLVLKDGDTGLVIDSLVTSNTATFTFTGKPNRNYEFITLNGDSLQEKFTITTVPNQSNFDYVSLINGPTKNDDWANNEKRRQDSIDALGLNTKFIVHYDFNKSIITKGEQVILDSLLKVYQKFPDHYLVIGGFTDCFGAENYNYGLSGKRGKSVKAYLIKQGVAEDKIIFKGYANKFLVQPCATQLNAKSVKSQRINRRAEIILSNVKDTDWELLNKYKSSNQALIYETNIQ
jgi:outer membrane protein OmpA-like peptidoglycan-associated protein